VYPRVELGPLTVYTYGLMVAIGLAVAIGLVCLELRRKGIDPAHGLWIALIVIPSGVVGAKLLFVVEEWDRFIADPTRVAFSGGGLSFYGGFLLGALAMSAYLRVKHVSFLVFADAAAPGALLGRGIARIGCHLAGDGDYGVPTALPWGTDYSHGIYPPSKALARLPELVRPSLGGVVRDDLPMHPTGVYEFLISALLFAVLWRYRARIRPDGRLFIVYLLTMGGVRFGLEFLALAPPVAFDLTEAQLISLGLIVIGAIGLACLRPHPASLKPLTRTR
jgi:phosphatidylglycerol---prolipoprotein diacylglyceryl transferase